MARVRIRGEAADLTDPHLVEGLPGIGLVGKIATDHLVEEFDMRHYADLYCDGLPRIGVYRDGAREVQPPVRLHVDESRDLLALQSDVPVSPSSAAEFAGCVTGWLDDHEVTPLFLSGMPSEKGPDPPGLFGVGTGGAGDLLERAGIDAPSDDGAVGGPTGALLNRAVERDLPAVALVVESDPQFPDPEAARVVLEHGIAPIVGAEVDYADLVDRAEEIRRTKEELARKMGEAEDEASKAQPLRMYQ